MNQRLYKIIAIVSALLIVFFVYYFKKGKENKEVQELPVTDSLTFVPGMNYVTPVPLPDTIEFAGEKVPLDIFYVREQMERELTVNTYWHSSTLLLLKRTGRWLPVIDPILANNGIPADFRYLAMAESGLMNVVSPSGAVGFWQFLEKTGKEYGLVVNKEVDERYDVAKATEAACKYLKASYAKFGSWTLVAASYNAGQGRIDDVQDDQLTKSYYEMVLNDETSRYVYRILAIKYIFQDPLKYGFKLETGDYYSPLKTTQLKVNQSISDLPAWARQHKTTYRMLKELNPWLRSDKLNVRKGEEFNINLPAE
jgi:membrane-bound lytic murein transglycosylase D